MSKKLTDKRKKWLNKKAKKGIKSKRRRKRYEKLRNDPYFREKQAEKMNIYAELFYKNFQELFLDSFNKKNNTDLQIQQY